MSSKAAKVIFLSGWGRAQRCPSHPTAFDISSPHLGSFISRWALAHGSRRCPENRTLARIIHEGALDGQ